MGGTARAILPSYEITKMSSRSNEAMDQHRVFLFCHPRTASNLLLRVLSQQSEWQFSAYHTMGAFLYAREECLESRSFESVPQYVQDEHAAMLDKAHSRLQEAIHESVQNVWGPAMSSNCPERQIHEHAQCG